MKMSIDVDSAAVVRMLSSLGTVAEARLLEAATVTGKRVADEARSRVARRTGKTAGAIAVAVDDKKKSVRVFVGRTSNPAGLPGWLEWGTSRMRARPFLFASARLEEAPHMRRVKEALQDAVDEASK